jgi:alanyl-tRNA synthetase
MIINMKAGEIRQRFFDFFRQKNHEIVPSASMVIRNDPTLMFTNAGMNQFKDIFLGNQPVLYKRVANSQKCLRVSGKHNDLEEVGHDTYHHTMFEMLGNWSFGDYFKKEAIEWSWDFLTKELKISEDRLYATIFEGSPGDKVPRDDEAAEEWKKYFKNTKNHILEDSKKNNFWEMGDTGPCGPCSEIHIDLRDDAERKKTPGHLLINKGHSLVIEIWNLVFIQYNRKADGQLEQLPSKHVDTGMGLERLCMIVQGMKSNYDTDIFQSIIHEISGLTGKEYGKNEHWDIALRVVADHLRAVSFSIADGQLPSNNKAGYVIRRILRRAVRYLYNYLETEEPLLYRLVPALVREMGDQYPELISGEKHISRVIYEEETSFLKTLGKGLKMIERKVKELKNNNTDVLLGETAFELYDTYGFPVDLTQLILREHDMKLDLPGFNAAMAGQKKRSREDANVDTGDWNIIRDSDLTEFTGYDKIRENILITKYRKVKIRGKYQFHLVFDRTPFYAESGGQAGDRGYIEGKKEKITILDTVKENNLILHITEELPKDILQTFNAMVDSEMREMTANNHTATHLLHNALRTVLGTHVEQKGSLVTPDRLRFDFSHFAKPGRDEIIKIESLVNKMIRDNLERKVFDNVPFKKASEMGAMALFGEKYGDEVRIVEFGKSVELCGGTHVTRTGNIGYFKIISEGAIAAGIRRIEAFTGLRAEEYINSKLVVIEDISSLLKSSGNILASVEKLVSESSDMRKTIEKFKSQELVLTRKNLESNAIQIGDFRLISSIIETDSTETLKTIAHQVRNSADDIILVIGAEIGGKANIIVMVCDRIIRERKLSAVSIIKEIAPYIEGGGGGQPFLASAGGKKAAGLKKALNKAQDYLRNIE